MNRDSHAPQPRFCWVRHPQIVGGVTVGVLHVLDGRGPGITSLVTDPVNAGQKT